MERETAARLFESLSSGARLDVFRLLVKQEPNGMNAGDIATNLGLPASTLSFHLKALTHAGLVTATPNSRFIRYRANVTVMFDLIGYLTDDCCGGQPGLCVDATATPCTTEDTAPSCKACA